ncbi:hypothetical protein ScPMuIL_017982 [Solemya velum]
MLVTNIPGFTLLSGEKIASDASPIDLSLFGNNSGRDSDSPLDLSVKTRKRHADSTAGSESSGQPKVKRLHIPSQPLDLRSKDQSVPTIKSDYDTSMIKGETNVMNRQFSRNCIENPFHYPSRDKYHSIRQNTVLNTTTQKDAEIPRTCNPMKVRKHSHHGLDPNEEFFQMIRGMKNIGVPVQNRNHYSQGVRNPSHPFGVRTPSSLSGARTSGSHSPRMSRTGSSSLFDTGVTQSVLRCSPDSTTMKHNRYSRVSVPVNVINSYSSLGPNPRASVPANLVSVSVPSSLMNRYSPCISVAGGIPVTVSSSVLNNFSSIRPDSGERYNEQPDMNSINDWTSNLHPGHLSHQSVSSHSLSSLQCLADRQELSYAIPQKHVSGSTIHYRTTPSHPPGWPNTIMYPGGMRRGEVPIGKGKLHAREKRSDNTTNVPINGAGSRRLMLGSISSHRRAANEVSARSITTGTSGLVQSQQTKYHVNKSGTKSAAKSDNKTSTKCQPTFTPPVKPAEQNPSAPLCSNVIPIQKTEQEKYHTPLSIAIPPTSSDGKQQTNELITRHPKLAFKKQFTLGPASTDENSKTQAPSECTKTPEVSRANCSGSTAGLSTIMPSSKTLGSTSPNPSSPKMPTLSPQYKLPPPLISPLTIEPPKLDRLETNCAELSIDKHENSILPNQGAMNPIAKIRPGIKITAPTEAVDTSYPVITDNSPNMLPQSCDHSDLSRQQQNNCQSLFSKDKTKCSFSKHLGCNRKIPVANVAPMVHKKPELADVGDSAEVDFKPENKLLDSVSSCCVRSSVIQNRQPTNSLSDPNNQSIHPQTDMNSEIKAKIEKTCTLKPDLMAGVADGPVKLSPLMKKILRQRQLSEEHSISKNVSDDREVPDCERERGRSDTGHESDRGENDADDNGDLLCGRSLKSKNHRRSILDEIANSKGFVGESKRMKAATTDLLSDPSLLSREDRALRRAIEQFEKMETKKDNQLKSTRKKAIISNTKRKADQLRKKARQRDHRLIEGNKRIMKNRLKNRRENQKGFVDFKPRILKSRTRMQAAGKRGLAKYDRNAAYDKELTREETRNELRKRARLEQHGTRSCTRSRSRSKSLVVEPPETTPVHEGSWEIQGRSQTLKQTLRSGRSKGGLMLKLSWRPKGNKYHRRLTRRHDSSRPPSTVIEGRIYPTRNRKRNCPYKKRNGESYSFVRNAGHYLRQNIRKVRSRKELQKSVSKDEPVPNYSIVTRSREQRVNAIQRTMRVKKVRRTKRRLRRQVKPEGIRQFSLECQEEPIPFPELWCGGESATPSLATPNKIDPAGFPWTRRRERHSSTGPPVSDIWILCSSV